MIEDIIKEYARVLNYCRTKHPNYFFGVYVNNDLIDKKVKFLFTVSDENFKQLCASASFVKQEQVLDSFYLTSVKEMLYDGMTKAIDNWFIEKEKEMNAENTPATPVDAQTPKATEQKNVSKSEERRNNARKASTLADVEKQADRENPPIQ